MDEFVMHHFHTFLASISQDILHLSEIMEIKENVKRVQFIEKTVKFKGFYESIAEGQQQLSKSLINADWSREEGNKLYREEHFLPAIEKFNASICFAPDDSHQLGKAYGNRSAAYFSIKMYDLCLKNIRLARKNNLPEKLMLKLNEREKKCLQEMQKSKSSSDIVFNGVKPELSFPVHDTVPFIANCLELRNNRRYGRHIVSNTELKVGDIVAIEPPFCSVASSSIQHIACANCFRENDLDLIPCRGCHSVMFCNEECYKQAVDAFHDIECPIINVLCSSIINAAQNVAIRLLILAVKSFNTVDELIQFVKDVENNENNAFTVDYQNNEKLGLLAAILKFDSYEGKSLPFVINTSAVVAVAYKLLLQHTGFKDLFKTKAQINFLIGFFYHLCEIANTNSVQSATMISIQWNIDTIGIRLKARTEMFPFSNLFNHSCAPNVTRVKHGLKSVIIVTKPIAEGEQLFLCYGLNHRSVDWKTRQESLYAKFMFRCQCIACLKNYPMANLQKLHQQNDIIKPILHVKLCLDYKVVEIKQLIPLYCGYLNAKSKGRYPNDLTDIAEDMLDRFWEILYADSIPFPVKCNLLK